MAVVPYYHGITRRFRQFEANQPLVSSDRINTRRLLVNDLCVIVRFQTRWYAYRSGMDELIANLQPENSEWVEVT
jgi:hypothetical protein